MLHRQIRLFKFQFYKQHAILMLYLYFTYVYLGIRSRLCGRTVRPQSGPVKWPMAKIRGPYRSPCVLLEKLIGYQFLAPRSTRTIDKASCLLIGYAGKSTRHHTPHKYSPLCIEEARTFYKADVQAGSGPANRLSRPDRTVAAFDEAVTTNR